MKYANFVFSLWILGTFLKLSLPENQIIVERRKLSFQRTNWLDQVSSSLAHSSAPATSNSIKFMKDAKLVFSLWILGTFLELSWPKKQITIESIKISFQPTTPLDQAVISLLARSSEVRRNIRVDALSTRTLIFSSRHSCKNVSYLMSHQNWRFWPDFFGNL